MVTIEQTRCQCDHCEELGQGVIVTTVNGDEITSIQLCNDCASYFGKEMNPSLITTIESQKEEIEKYRREAMNERELGESIVAERERLYAITELAVKGLKLELKDAKVWESESPESQERIKRLTITLIEIERLSQ